MSNSGIDIESGAIPLSYIDRALHVVYENALHLFPDLHGVQNPSVRGGQAFKSDAFHKELAKRRAKHPQLFSLLFDRLQTSASIQMLALNDYILEAAVKFLGVEGKECLTAHTVQVRLDAPGDRRNALTWHQDSAYHGQNEDGANGVVVWFPLLCEPAELGELEVLPGSQVHGHVSVDAVRGGTGYSTQYPIPDSIISQHEPKRIQLGVGDFAIFSLNMIHRSAPNSTGRFRVTMQVRLHNAFAADFRPGRLIYKYSS